MGLRMTLYALIRDSNISQVAALPRLWHDGSRWWDFRTPDPAILAARGWLPVVETPRPADTDTTTHDYSVELVAGLPVVTWTPRPWTPEEMVSRAEQAARLALATVEGSAAMAAGAGESPAVLADRVASPGGEPGRPGPSYRFVASSRTASGAPAASSRVSRRPAIR